MLFLLIVLMVLFRGPLFRLSVRYEPLGERPVARIGQQELQQRITSALAYRKLDVGEVVSLSRRITDGRLSFTSGESSNRADDVYQAGKANCVGYAALFSAIVQQVIASGGTEEHMQVTHLVGKLQFFGWDIHALFGNHPFFQDHDFVHVRDLERDVDWYIDPSVSDYLGINFVKIKQP